jgi:hypothetical protein
MAFQQREEAAEQRMDEYQPEARQPLRNEEGDKSADDHGLSTQFWDDSILYLLPFIHQAYIIHLCLSTSQACDFSNPSGS